MLGFVQVFFFSLCLPVTFAQTVRVLRMIIGTTPPAREPTFYIMLIRVHVRVDVYVKANVHVEVREQLTGISSLFPTCRSQGSKDTLCHLVSLYVAISYTLQFTNHI